MTDTVLTSLFLPSALVLIMFAVGLDLRLSDFVRVVESPGAVASGTLAQIVLVPAIGLTVAFVAPLTPALAVGVVIIAACPGGAVSNLISYLSRADVALSVSLTAISSVVTVFTIPLIVNFAIRRAMPSSGLELPMIWTSLRLAALTLIPVLVGMVLRHLYPAMTRRYDRFIRRLSVIVLAAVILVAIRQHIDELPLYFRHLAIPLIVLNGAAIGSGWVVARLAALDEDRRMTLMIETGIQNGALGITIPAVWIGDPEMAIPPAIYGVLMLISGAILIIFSPSRRRRAQRL